MNICSLYRDGNNYQKHCKQQLFYKEFVEIFFDQLKISLFTDRCRPCMTDHTAPDLAVAILTLYK